MSSRKPPVITIDGASGTGKGVVSQQVAAKLGWKLLDSGVLYRAVAFVAEKHRIPLDDHSSLATVAETLDIQFIADNPTVPAQVNVENENVTDFIRTEQIGNAASKIGAIPAVRTALLDRQRAFQTWPGLVADGRDMGTIIFPDAPLKIFLTASAEEQARRRYKQLKEKGINVNLSSLVLELRERDQRDRERKVAPLKPAVDAICIDTDSLTIQEVVQRIMSEANTLFLKVQSR